MKSLPMRVEYWLVRAIVRWFFRLVFGLRIRGLKNIPRKGALIVACNHVSFADPPLVGSVTPREMSYAAKQELFKGPLGVFLRINNGIPIRRSGSDKEAIKALSASLREDKAVLIFPEGTRTLKPDAADIKAGVGMLASMGRADVIPVRVDGTRDLKYSFWHRGTMTITYGHVIRLSEIMRGDVPKRDAYRLIAEQVMEQIRSMGSDKEPLT